MNDQEDPRVLDRQARVLIDQLRFGASRQEETGKADADVKGDLIERYCPRVDGEPRTFASEELP